jgi:hypothetical protein
VRPVISNPITKTAAPTLPAYRVFMFPSPCLRLGLLEKLEINVIIAERHLNVNAEQGTFTRRIVAGACLKGGHCVRLCAT